MLDGHILSFGPYRLDTAKVQLWCESQPVRLTPKAFQVLCYVVERPGQLVTKEELFRVVWADTVVGDAALTMCIQEIRKALQDNSRSPQYLETVHRRGFRFIASVVTAAAPVPSSGLQVLSQEEGVSKRNGETNGQDHGQEGIARQEDGRTLTVQANPWMPAKASMTGKISASLIVIASFPRKRVAWMKRSVIQENGLRPSPGFHSVPSGLQSLPSPLPRRGSPGALCWLSHCC
jgi:DNA-binding winged helix-turn-helix (wHTH) protein